MQYKNLEQKVKNNIKNANNLTSDYWPKQRRKDKDTFD